LLVFEKKLGSSWRSRVELWEKFQIKKFSIKTLSLIKNFKNHLFATLFPILESKATLNLPDERERPARNYSVLVN
jgi:hypothetical protein